jgi:hypothetical protein
MTDIDHELARRIAMADLKFAQERAAALHDKLVEARRLYRLAEEAVQDANKEVLRLARIDRAKEPT